MKNDSATYEGWIGTYVLKIILQTAYSKTVNTEESSF